MALVVANIRRGRSGRRLLAVRTNERAAAALGISVPGAKVYAFALSAGIAALGGVLLALPEGRRHLQLRVHQLHVDPRWSAWPFIGGIGFLFGPIFGSTLAPGSLGAQISERRSSASIGQYVQLIGGVLLILLVLQNQDGIAKESIEPDAVDRRPS